MSASFTVPDDLIPQTAEEQDRRIAHLASLITESFVDPSASGIGDVSSADMFLVECVLLLLTRVQKLESKIAEMDQREVSPYGAVMIASRANECHY